MRQILGAGGGEQVLTLVDAIMAGDAAAGLRAINATIDDGADSRQFSGQIVDYLRALLHAAAAPNRALDEEVDTPVAPEHIAGFTLGEIAALVKRFSQVDYGIRHSAYGHLPLELCLIDAVLARTGEMPAATVPVATTARPAATPPRPLPNRPTPSRPTAAEPPPERPAPPERMPTPIRPDATGPRAVPTPEDAAPAERPAVPPPPPIPRAPADLSRPIAALPTTPAPVTPPTPAAAPPAQQTAALPDIPLEQLHELWPRIRQGVRAINRRIEALLASTNPYMVSEGTLTLVAASRVPPHRPKQGRHQARNRGSAGASPQWPLQPRVYHAGRGRGPPRARAVSRATTAPPRRTIGADGDRRGGHLCAGRA